MQTPTQPTTSNRTPTSFGRAMFVIILTIFLNAMGFTFIIPFVPFLVAHFVSDPTTVGLTVGTLTSIYAICQFLAAPGLGALSDHFGRRPVLLLCLLGSAFGYLLLGLGGALWVLFLGRIIDGLTGANNAILNAYVADMVPPEERGKYYGWIGAIASVSIVVGPAIGGFMARFGTQVPFFLAGGIAVANIIFGLLFLPESLPKEHRTPTLSMARLNPFSTMRDVLSMPQLRGVLTALFLVMLAFIAITANLSLFAKDAFNWDTGTVGLLFSVFGVVSIAGQAVLLPLLLKRLGPALVAVVGLVFAIAGYLVITLAAVISASPLVFAAMVLLAIGEGFISPCLLDLITRATDARSQGKVQGGSTSIQSLASMAGPLMVGALYDHVGHASPYLVGTGILALALAAILAALPTLSRQTPAAQPNSDPAI